MQVWAQAYDNPIPGFNTPTTGNLRLWDALPLSEFDLTAFNAGDYDRVRERERKAALAAAGAAALPSLRASTPHAAAHCMGFAAHSSGLRSMGTCMHAHVRVRSG